MTLNQESQPYPGRIHLAQKPDAITLHEVIQGPGVRSGAYKPGGFWYEVDGDWRRWCAGEDYFTDQLYYAHRVELNDCNVRTIATLAELDAFDREFGWSKYRGERYTEIEWTHVAALWDGLEIAPYQWERRLSPTMAWYYSWDCASGVIWRPRNATVTYLGEYQFEQRREEVAS